MFHTSSAEILERGMSCLLEQLGVIETEKFISVLIREKYDYTKWRRTFFGDARIEEINKEAVAYAHEHPFVPKCPQVEIYVYSFSTRYSGDSHYKSGVSSGESLRKGSEKS